MGFRFVLLLVFVCIECTAVFEWREGIGRIGLTATPVRTVSFA